MKRLLLISILAIAAIPLHAYGQPAQSVPVEFLSGGEYVRGQFFRSMDSNPIATLVLVPGWPGNPRDVLGLGALLAELHVNVLTFNPRGLHQSEGTSTHAHTLEDIGAALEWLRQADIQQRFRVDMTRIALGGHCYGGGMAMAYAAADPRVRHVISIAGNDHGVFIRRVQKDPQFAEAIRQMLASTRAPNGPARFDVETGLKELADHQDIYGLRENAPRLADRSILLVGGWEDVQVTVEDVLLPLYRGLKAEGATDVTFLTYHDTHNFDQVRQELARDIHEWLVRHLPH
ncbi:alpha/beta fold hydrolase [bacterium]|nr:MAG: alpha/beta fold hydrolase [bacterium]